MCAFLSQAASPTLAIYSQDGLGLGHMRRTSSIANQLITDRPEAGVLTLSDSPLGQFFRNAPNHDYIKLPSIVKLGPGNWSAVNLPLDFEKVKAIREDLIRSILLTLKPEVLLVDHMPHGAMGELIPALQAVKEAGVQTRVVLGLRDILDAPEVVTARWQEEGAFEALKNFYDMVLVYGMQGVFDVADQYHFPPEIINLMRYCGFVCTPLTARYPARIRSQMLSGTKKGARLIVAMAGGGADAYPMMSAVLDAFPAVLAKEACALVLITGQFMPAEQRHELERRARGLPVRVRIMVNDSLSYIEASDVMLAMAGYNTTIEILRSGKPAILIPRKGPSAEQRTRARLFADRGWVEFIDPSELNPDRLADTILANLHKEKAKDLPGRPILDGIRVAVQYLLSLFPATPVNKISVPSMEYVDR